MWRVCKSAGRPWPVLAPGDDVLDYMIMEAVALKVNKQDTDAQEEAERQRKIKEFKQQEKERLKKLVR